MTPGISKRLWAELDEMSWRGLIFVKADGRIVITRRDAIQTVLGHRARLAALDRLNGQARGRGRAPRGGTGFRSERLP